MTDERYHLVSAERVKDVAINLDAPPPGFTLDAVLLSTFLPELLTHDAPEGIGGTQLLAWLLDLLGPAEVLDRVGRCLVSVGYPSRAGAARPGPGADRGDGPDPPSC